MSTKEYVYSVIDTMDDEQLNALSIYLADMMKKQREENRKKIEALKGIMHDVANSDLIPLEKEAWANAAVEKHQRFLEEMKNANS